MAEAGVQTQGGSIQKTSPSWRLTYLVYLCLRFYILHSQALPWGVLPGLARAGVVQQ